MKPLTKVIWLWLPACLLVLAFAPAVVRAQCVASATRETAIGIMNASHYTITFYIDGVNQGTVPAGARGTDVIISAGEHLVMAETILAGELYAATRTIVIPAGSVCTWTITNPTMIRRPAATLLVDPLQRSAFVSLAVPN